MSNNLLNLKSFTTVLLVSGGLLVSGCDDDSSPTSPGADGETTISGQVTDDSGFAKSQNVEDADVRASEVDDDGNRNQEDGEATTDENGNYTLRTNANAEVMVVTATKADFESSALVAKRASANAVSAMEMNAETHAEADVFVEAKRQDGDDEPVTTADVALHVNSETAADIESGNTTSTLVASSIRAAIEAEARYMKQNNAANESQIEASAQNRNDAFLQLQSDLSAGVDVSTSMNAFASAVAEAHTDAGVDVSSSAEARQTATVVIEALSSGMSSNARFALRQNAELLAALSTSAAAESEFEAQSMNAEASAISSAGAQLRAAILAADSESDIDSAWATFESKTKAQLSSGLSIGSALLATIETNLASLRSDFESDVSGATTVDAFVQAKSDFNTNARSQVQSHLSSSSNAEFAARVFTLVSAR